MQINTNLKIKPTRQNSFVWLNIILVIFLLITGKTDAMSIVFAYFLETFIIGVIHLFKMFLVYRFTKNQQEIKRKEDGLYALVFFSFHYSFFVAVQLIFVFVAASMVLKEIKEPFHLITNIRYVLTNLKGIHYILASLTVTNLIDFYLNFVKSNSYKNIEMEKLFFQPYLRIIIQQFAVIFGMFFMIFSVALKAIAILIVGIKALIDFYLITHPKNNIFTKHKSSL